MSKVSVCVVSIILVILLVFSYVAFMAPPAHAFNQQIFDLKYHFKYAVLMRDGGEQLIEIKNWTDYEDSDVVQFTSTDGITYLTHYSNVILLSDKEK